ncbi:MAG: hypothetical protein IJ816_03990 [Alloprevotella sp.]|nr:hypothetical protein [Alloprevotella sp.]
MKRCGYILLWLGGLLALTASRTDLRAQSAYPAQWGVAEADLKALLRDGDLLFETPREKNRITSVTQAEGSLPTDHVGVYFRGYIWEAIPAGVVQTPLTDFLERNRVEGTDGRLGLMLGRVEAPYSLRKTMKRIRALAGKPYDDLYLPGDSAIYCSELVQTCFVTKRGRLVLEAVPMTFRDETGEIPEVWQLLYARHGMRVPEGRPGSNPAELSRRAALRILLPQAPAKPAEDIP